MENEKKDTQNPKSEEDKTSNDESQKNENEDLDNQTLLIQKKKMREQRDEAREEIAKLKEEHTIESKGDDSSDSKSQEQPKGMSKRVQALEFSQSHPELDSKVANDVLEFAEAKGIDPEKALENDIIKPYIEKAKEEAEVANATPNSNRSPKVEPKKPVSEMTEEEHKEYFRKMQGLK